MARKKQEEKMAEPLPFDDYYNCAHCNNAFLRLVVPVVEMDGLHLLECPTCGEREYKKVDKQYLPDEEE